MKLAFLISAHTDPEHLRRLTEALPPEAHCFVHIDRKSDLQPFTALMNGPRIHFIHHRVDVVWGSFVEVEYQMELLRAAMNYDRYDRYVTLSGLDYPLWANRRIVSYFEQAGEQELLQGICMTDKGAKARNYAEFRLMNARPWPYGSLGSKLRVGLRKALYAAGIRKTLTIYTDQREYQLYKGAAWWAITHQLATYVLDQWDHNRQLVGYFKTSFCPAETFVQTVAFNSPFASKCLLKEGAYTTLADLTPLTFIDYSPVIKILDATDYDRLVATGKMFCRKTVSGQSDALLDRIDLLRAQD
ncbi:MAG: conjugal transfer protein [Prevotella sp.]|nr:conjugal transfer protein [Prevotella sp.]